MSIKIYFRSIILPKIGENIQSLKIGVGYVICEVEIGVIPES